MVMLNYLAVSYKRVVEGVGRQDPSEPTDALRAQCLVVLVVWQCTQQIKLNLKH